MSEALFVLQDLTKTFCSPKEKIIILDHIDLQIKAQECVAIVGASGSGKTTLLQIMGGLDIPTSGQVLFQGHNLNDLSWDEKTKIRNKQIGYVFQFHHLLPEFSTLENVALPMIIGGETKSQALSRARQLLHRFGLEHLAEQRVSSLSGGERQLTAIARAMIQNPLALLADEPTGNLDRKNAQKVTQLFQQLSQKSGTSIVLVTHNLDLAKAMHKIFKLEKGKLIPG